MTPKQFFIKGPQETRWMNHSGIRLQFASAVEHYDAVEIESLSTVLVDRACEHGPFHTLGF